MNRHVVLAAVVVFSVLHPCLAGAEPLRDGKRFDPGAGMTAPADGAPEELERARFVLGTWDVEQSVFEGDSLLNTSKGTAHITFMNRGHAMMERFHAPDFDGRGHEVNTLSFLMYNAANTSWLLGEANSHTESVTLLSGDFENESLVLETTIRRLGGARLTHYRLTLRSPGPDVFESRWEETSDGGPWVTTVRRSYHRRVEPTDLFEAASPYGAPAPGLVKEARQFDFLIGEWEESHEMVFPGGQEAKFPADGTAVHCLNGHAILEFGWYDVDPSLPDAATTIVRIYNRAMRRWECMYSTNRFNGILHFGGAKEEDRIVLHQFEANVADSPLSYWIFRDGKKNSYRWHAETSRDRGETFQNTWTIEGTRKASRN